MYIVFKSGYFGLLISYLLHLQQHQRHLLRRLDQSSLLQCSILPLQGVRRTCQDQ